MIWTHYPIFFWLSLISWAIAIIALAFPYKKHIKTITDGLTLLGALSIFIFILILWIDLDRPPFRTLGETRLWYSFFMPLIGFAVLKQWKYRFFAAYSLLIAIVFLFINFLKPDIHDKTLMPALQSVWFVPHVIVYIISYSMLGAAALASLFGLYGIYFNKLNTKFVELADNLVYAGFAFLTLGLVFGGLWAKVAWGHYWTWDPKETWALLTWLSYLIYMHVRYKNTKQHKTALWVLVLSFGILLLCWFGINYLPAAQNSVHVYSS